MSDLQARRDAQTRSELSEVAIRLFADRGFVETTMEEVAEASGVSRRTVYRHFPTKEDLLFEQARLWIDVLDAELDTRESGESTYNVLRRSVLKVAAFIESQRADVLPAYAVVAATPSLMARYARSNRDWLERYVEVLSADVGERSDEILKAAVLAGALVGGTDSAAVIWSQNPQASLVGLTECVLENVEPLWPDSCR